MSIKPDVEETVIVWSDYWNVLKRHWRKVVVASVVCACFGGCYALSRPVTYRAEALLEERSQKQNNFAERAQSLFSGESLKAKTSGFALAITLDCVVEPMIQRLGLQAVISSSEDSTGVWQYIQKNVRLQWAKWRHSNRSPIAGASVDFWFKDLTYKGDLTASFDMHFLSEEQFELIDGDGVQIIEGHFGEEVYGPDFVGTFIRSSSKPLTGAHYTVTLQPLTDVVKSLGHDVQIANAKEGQQILEVAYSHPNRYLAAKITNALMCAYQDHVRLGNERQSHEQLLYLERRQQEIAKKLEKLLVSHAEVSKERLDGGGFVEIGRELEFLAKTQEKIKGRLAEIELERKLVDGVIETGDQQIHNLEALHKDLERIQTILVSVQKDEEPTLNGEESHPVNKMWVSELRVSWLSLREGAPQKDSLEKSSDYQAQKTAFINYLYYQIRLLDVRKQLVEERLSKETTSADFQGIDDQTIKEFYVTYQQQLDKLEISMHQLRSIAGQMRQGQFEMSSLVHALEDSVSQELIKGSSKILLEGLDQNNRSAKEQGRFKNQLAMQKEFIAQHISNTIELYSLQSEVIRQKIKGLQEVRKTRLEYEAQVLQNQLKDSSEEMRYLPQKWISEQQLKFWTTAYLKLAEEITLCVEVKSHSNDLDATGIRSLSYAAPPLSPQELPLIRYMVLAGALGCMFSVSALFIQTWAGGVRASPENLALKGESVSGGLSGRASMPLSNSDLGTLRSLMAFLSQHGKISGPEMEEGFLQGQTLLCLLGSGSDYTPSLAALLHKTGKKVLVLQGGFGHQAFKEEEKGLLQYLEGTISAPHIFKEEGYDLVVSGGYTRYATELLLSSRYRELLSKYQYKYDYVLLTTTTSVVDPAAEELLDLVDVAAVTLSEERLHQLERFLQRARSPAAPKPTTFLFA